MICFKVNGIELARAENKESILKKEVTIYRGNKIEKVSLEEALENYDEFIISKEIENTINNFLSFKSEINKDLSNFPNSFQIEYELYKKDLDTQLDIDFDKVLLENEIIEEDIKTFDKQDAFLTNGVYYPQIRDAKDNNANSRREQDELDNNPYNKFFQYLLYGKEGEPFLGINFPKTIRFKAISTKSLREGFFKDSSGKVKYKDVTILPKSDTELSYDAWGKEDSEVNLILVDDNGEIFLIDGYLIRTSVDQKKSPFNLIKDAIYELDKESYVYSRPSLHKKNTAEIKTNITKLSLTELKEKTIKVAIGEIEGVRSGEVFLTIEEGLVPNKTLIKFNRPIITVDKYVDILTNIQTLIQEILESDEDEDVKKVRITKNIPVAWNMLVKHSQQKRKSGLDYDYFYKDFAQGVGIEKEIFYKGKGYGYGISIALNDSNTDRIIILKDIVLRTQLVNGKLKFEEITFEKASNLIKSFADSKLKGLNERKFYLPIQKGNKEEPYAVVDLSSYENIFGYKEEGIKKEQITSLDVLSNEFSTNVMYSKNNPSVLNLKLTLKSVANPFSTVQQNEAESEVKKDKKKVPGFTGKKGRTNFERNLNLEQLGETITQKDIDNIKKIFPSLEGREIRLLAATSKTDFWGKVTNYGWTLLDSATTGTLYHEAWHEYSQWYLTKQQKKDLYNKVFSIIGINDEKEAEEFLAEEFAKYKLGLPIDKKLDSYFKRNQNWFKKILNFIKNFFNIGEYKIYNAFNTLSNVINGKEKLKYFSESNVKFDKLNKAITVFETDTITGEVKERVIFSNLDMVRIVNLLDSLLFKHIEDVYISDKGNASYYSEFGNNTQYKPNLIVSEIISKNNFKNLFNILKLEIDNLQNENSDYDFINKIKDNFTLVIDNYIKETLLPFKNTSGIEVDENDEIISRNSVEFKEGNENEVSVDMDKEIKAIINSLKQPKRNIRMTKEQYLATLEVNKFNAETDEYLEADEVADEVYFNLTDNAVELRNEFYELNEFGLVFKQVNLSQTVNKIYSLLSNANNYSDMLKILEENAEENPEFWELLSKLPSKSEVQEGNLNTLMIASKFEANKRVMFSFYNSMMNVNVKKTTETVIDNNEVIEVQNSELFVEANLTEAVKNNFETIKKENATNFLLNKFSITIGDKEYNSIEEIYYNILSDSSNMNLSNFKDLFSRDVLDSGFVKSSLDLKSIKLLEDIVKDRNKSFKLIKNKLFLLESIGISLSKETIKYIINNKEARSTFENQINLLFFESNNGLSKFYQVKKIIENKLNLLKEKYSDYVINGVLVNSEKINFTLAEEGTSKEKNFFKIFGKEISYNSLQTKYLTILSDVPFENLLIRNLALESAATQILNILKTESKFTTLAYTTVVKNANGDLVNTLYLYNSLSKMISAINDFSCKNISEIVEKYPYVSVITNFLSDTRNLLTDNLYLNSIFDKNGDRKKDSYNNYKKLEWANIGGNILSIDGKELAANSSTKLNEIDKILQNLIMNDKSQRIKRPGDKSTESMLFVDLGLIEESDYYEALINYVTNEIVYANIITTKRELKEFKFLSNFIYKLNDNKTFESEEEIVSFVNKNKKEIKKQLENFINKDVDYYEEKLKSYKLENLAKKILNPNEYNLRSSIKKFILTKQINSITQNNLFYGYTGLYSDMFKRNSNIISTGIFPSIDENIIQGVNKMYIYSHGNILRLRENDEFREKHDNILNSWLNVEEKYEAIKDLINQYSEQGEFFNPKNPLFNVEVVKKSKYEKPSKHIKDIESSLEEVSKISNTGFDTKKIVDAYSKNNLADAQAWVSFDFYRNFKMLVSKWTEEQEFLYQRLSAGIDVKFFKGKPIESFFPPIKPQYAGYVPSENNLDVKQAFDKLSFMPYIPFVYNSEDSKEFEEFGKNLSKNNIAYSMTEDALKVGEEGLRYLANIKEQVNIEAKDHDHSIFPKQLLQIIGGFSKNSENEWIKYDNNGNIESFEDLVSDYENNINALSNFLKEELKEEIGYSEDEDGVVDFDLSKFKKIIDAELQSRQFRQPIIDAVDIVDKNGTLQFKYNLEAVLAKQSITSLIESVINRRLVRLMVNGDMAVQASAYMVANELMFYKLGNINGVRQTLPASCKISLRGQWKKLLDFKDKEGKKIKSLTRLNLLLKELKTKLTTNIDDIKLDEWELNFLQATQITGVRIPTQGLNSMEVLFIEEFLDPKVGGLIVIHEEITTKSGSDFDIDKLILMYPYLEVIGKEELTEKEYNEFKELEEYFGDRNVKNNKKTIKELSEQIDELSKDIKEIKDNNKYLKRVVDLIKAHKLEEFKYLNEQEKLSKEYIEAKNNNDTYTMNLIKEKHSENKEEIQEKRDKIESLKELLENSQNLININFDTLEYELITKDLLNASFEDKNDKYSQLIQNIDEIKKYNKFLDLKERNDSKKFIQNDVLKSIKNLLTTPIRYIELIYPNSTELIGSGGLTVKENGKTVADTKLAVNKLEIKRLLEQVMKNPIDYADLFDGDMLNVERFLDWTLVERNKSLNTAFSEANTQRAEDIKFVNGLGVKRLVGIAALQVTMINLISNLEIGVSTTIQVTEKSVYNLPLHYFTQSYLEKILKSGYLKFTTETDNFNKKEFDESLNTNVVPTTRLIKRVLAEQMVNPIVDSLNDKNPIGQINVNEESLATVEFMAIYLGISIDVVYNLLNQPLVLQHLRNKAINKSNFLNKLKDKLNVDKEREGFNLISNYMFELTDDYKLVNLRIKELKEGSITSFEEEDIVNMFDTVGKSLEDLMSNKNERIKQFQYLADYVKFETYAEDYRKLQSSTNWATNTQNSYLDSYYKLLEFELIANKGTFTNLYNLQNSVVSNFKVQDFSINILNSFFPLTTNKRLINTAIVLTQFFNSKTNSKFFRLFINDYFKYIIDNVIHDSKFFELYPNFEIFYNVSKELFINAENSPTKNTGTGLVEKVLRLKKDDRFLNNEFIQKLDINKKNGIKYNISVISSSNEVSNSDAITEGILHLIEEEPVLGSQFALLGLLQDGLNKSPISWSEYLPPESYYKFVEKAFEYFLENYNSNRDLLNYTYLFFKNNPTITNESRVVDDSNAVKNFFSRHIAMQEAFVSGYTYKNYYAGSRLNSELKFIFDESALIFKLNMVDTLNKGFLLESKNEKDNIRAKNSNEFIGFGDSVLVKNYKNKAEQGYIFVNSGQYDSNSKAFVAIDYTADLELKDLYIKELSSVLEQGGSLIYKKLDNKEIKNNKLESVIYRELLDKYKDNLVTNNKSNYFEIRLKELNESSNSEKFILFKNGTKIPLEFSLNSGQKAALLKLESFINNPLKGIILLEGAAGTGKTTVMSLFKNYLDKQNIEVVNASPTNAANNVTLSMNSSAKVLTLHQLLGLSPTIDLKNYDLKNIKFNQDNKKDTVNTNSVVIIDETSMINDNILDLLNVLRRQKALKIIFVGDREQLPPPSQETISKIFLNTFIKNEDKIMLSQVMRTGDTPILDESLFTKENKEFSYETKITKDSSVIFMNSEEDFKSKIKDFVTSENFKNNKNYFRLLTGVNANLDKYNKLIRSYYHNSDNLGEIVEGDLLVGVSNFSIDYNTKRPLIVNSSPYEVISVKKANKKVELEYYKQENIIFEGYVIEVKNVVSNFETSIFLVSDTQENRNKLKELAYDIKEIYKRAENSKGREKRDLVILASEKSSLVTTMFELKENENVIYKKTFNFGYAISVHKSQGSTFNNIGILGDSLNFIEHGIKYTAISRAKENALILTSKKISNSSEANKIYNELGNKTTSENVIIDEENGTKPAKEIQNVSSFNKEIEDKLNNLEKELLKNKELLGAYDYFSSSNNGKWNSANNELLSLVESNKKAFTVYKLLIGEVQTFKEIVDSLNSRGIEIEYTERMKRADETMSADEIQDAINSYNNSSSEKTNDKNEIQKNILSENNLKDETEYRPAELIEKFPLNGVSKIIWNLIKDIVEKLDIKVKFSTNRVPENFGGLFDPSSGEILIKPSTLTNGFFSEVLVHEIVHALTTKIIDKVIKEKTHGLTEKQINAVKGLEKLFNSVKDNNNLENKYPVSNIFEFIAHLTNEDFVKLLESKNKNFIEKVVDFIIDILGINNANELAKKYLIDIISDGEFLKENGINLLVYDYVDSKLGSKVDNIDKIKKEIEDLKKDISILESSKPIISYRTKGNDFIKALNEDNAIGNPFSHLGTAQDEIGINIRSDKNNPNSLANRLTNPNWYAKDLFDVETVYLKNKSSEKAPNLNKEESLKYDMNLMYNLQLIKFKKNPELIDEINEQGGLEFIIKSSHIVGKKNSRWEGKGLESNFIKVLAKSYETVSKSLGKFVENSNNNSSNNEQTLSKKNIFKVTPIKSVDKKAAIKASISTQFIGFGEGIANSSTESYRQEILKQKESKKSLIVNSNNYDSNDVVFVSIPGKRGNEELRKEQQDKTIKLALEAIEKGATLITDNVNYIHYNSKTKEQRPITLSLEEFKNEEGLYNEGEKRLYENLKYKGYQYSEQTIDGEVLGVWKKTKDSGLQKPKDLKNEYGLYKTNSVKESVEEFISWLIGEKHNDKLQDYRQAIIDKIPDLKGKKILYYKDLKQPSHATALDYLINKYDWNSVSEKDDLSDLSSNEGGELTC